MVIAANFFTPTQKIKSQFRLEEVIFTLYKLYEYKNFKRYINKYEYEIWKNK